MSCSCGSTNDLILGTEEGGLTVKVRLGQARSFPLVLTEGEDETPIAWPAAPVMVFPDFSVAADLTPSDAPLEVVADAQATWELSAPQTLTLTSYTSVRIDVDGETWWSGVVECQS